MRASRSSVAGGGNLLRLILFWHSLEGVTGFVAGVASPPTAMTPRGAAPSIICPRRCFSRLPLFATTHCFFKPDDSQHEENEMFWQSSGPDTPDGDDNWEEEERIQRMATFLSSHLGRAVLKTCLKQQETKEEEEVPVLKEEVSSVAEEPEKEEVAVAAVAEEEEQEEIPSATEEPEKEELAVAAVAEEGEKEEISPAAEEPVKEELAVAAVAEEDEKEEISPAAEEPEKEELAVASVADEEEKEEIASAAMEPEKEELAVVATADEEEEEERAVPLHEREGDRVLALKDEFSTGEAETPPLSLDDVSTFGKPLPVVEEDSADAVTPVVAAAVAEPSAVETKTIPTDDNQVSLGDKDTTLKSTNGATAAASVEVPPAEDEEEERAVPMHEKEGDRIVSLKDEFSTGDGNNNLPPVVSTAFGRPLEVIESGLSPIRSSPSSTSLQALTADIMVEQETETATTTANSKDKQSDPSSSHRDVLNNLQLTQSSPPSSLSRSSTTDEGPSMAPSDVDTKLDAKLRAELEALKTVSVEESSAVHDTTNVAVLGDTADDVDDTDVTTTIEPQSETGESPLPDVAIAETSYLVSDEVTSTDSKTLASSSPDSLTVESGIVSEKSKKKRVVLDRVRKSFRNNANRVGNVFRNRGGGDQQNNKNSDQDPAVEATMSSTTRVDEEVTSPPERESVSARAVVDQVKTQAKKISAEAHGLVKSRARDFSSTAGAVFNRNKNRAVGGKRVKKATHISPVTNHKHAAYNVDLQGRNLEEEAFQILLDLGMIRITPNPNDPDYDHSNDEELCPENVWIN